MPWPVPPYCFFSLPLNCFPLVKPKAQVAAGGLLSAPLNLMSATVTQTVCLVLNHLLDQQRSSKTKLQKEAGKVLTLSIAPMSLNLRVNDQGYFQPSSATNGVAAPADTTISMQWADLIGSVSNPNSMSRKATIEGDMDFAQTVSTVINDLVGPRARFGPRGGRCTGGVGHEYLVCSGYQCPRCGATF